jgi:hypothetical protein
MQTAETITEPDAPTDTSESLSEPPTTGQDASDADHDPDGRSQSREAARYRTQLRDTEAERDSLREQLDRYQRGEVERVAASAGLAVPSDVWLHGADLSTLRGDSGEIDTETVTGLVADLIRDRPGLRAPVNGSLGIGQGAGATPPKPPKVGLSALLKP